jgi:HEAT repeat protein
MKSPSPIEQTWLKALQSKDHQMILSAIQEIRVSNAVSMYPAVLELINQKADSSIRNEIFRLISDTKSTEAVPILAELLRNNDYGDYLHALVAACWQSGLNFGPHLKVFAKIFVHGDYRTAIEAFTVIEESLPDAADDDINQCLQYLRDAQCMVTDEKMPLYYELRKVIEDN